ncbi:acyl-CoA N-acyltransferase [Aspergillus undulatus]|uniref:acyl-CoA N-acyltransferase n=1 Tax=Aspergillus undulatus TaxID=1810928 RepID=UPI003CCDACB4
MRITVRPLTKPDIPAAINIIQAAFADDPYFLWVFDKSKFNKARNYGSLEARCLWGIDNAIFHVAVDSDTDNTTPTGSNENGKIVGVSCWLPPHPASTPESWSSWFSTWTLWLRQGLNNVYHLGRGGLNVTRYYIWKARQAEAQRSIWTDKRGYYFCNIVAVDPSAQGKGVGRRLFQEVTDRADEEGVKCYLESSRDQPNVGIYERFGFDMKRVMECRDDSAAEGDKEGSVCMLYCMVRKPKKSSSS